MKHIKSAIILLLLGIVSFQGVLLISGLKVEQNEDQSQNILSANEEKIKHIEDIIRNPNLSERESLDSIPKQPKSVDDLFISGWIPDWDIPNGTQSVINGDFDGISPVFFWINDDGSLKRTAYTNDAGIISIAKNNEIELMPTITLFDTDIMSTVLKNEESIDAHINEILNEVTTNGYDGIDIDYESIYLKDKQNFFLFLEKLALQLAQQNKKLSFTVLPKWGDDVLYDSLPQTRMVQDYTRIANIVDEFRIMSYEFTARNAEFYGPIAPLPWIEDVIRYTILSGVPREKILLGIHTYAYDFTKRAPITKLEYYPTFFPRGTDKKPQALANFPSTVQSRQFDSVEYNEEWGEAIGRYTKDGIERIVIFPNQQSIDARKQLAADYGLKGVVYWRVGDEGSLVY